MQPILSVEFNVMSNDDTCKEESISLHSPEDLFNFIAPGGGCEQIPSEVDNIQILYLTPDHPNKQAPIADLHATLQLGMVFINGPMSEIAQTIEQIIDKAGRDELAESFLTVIGAC